MTIHQRLFRTMTFFATILIVNANPVLDLLERQRDVEHIDPNSHLNIPRETEAELAEKRSEVLLLNKDWSGSVGDALWSRAILFDSKENPHIQEFAVAGMLHADGIWGEVRSESEQDHINDTSLRRARFGARLKAFHRLNIEAIADLQEGDVDPDLLRLKVELDVTPRDRITVGKFRPGFSYGSSRDGQDLQTVRRSLLGQQLLPARTTGAMYTHEFNDWSASIGYFVGDVSGGLPSADGRGYLYAGAEGLLPGSRRSLANRWRLGYLYNIDPRGSSSTTQQRFGPGAIAFNDAAPLPNPFFRHLFSAGIEFEEGRYGFMAEMLFAQGEGEAFGFTLQPTYWLDPGLLQLIGRLHYASATNSAALVSGLGPGSGDDLVSAPFAAGDEFLSLYLGANLHIYQDRLKLLTGLEYTNLFNSTSGDRIEGITLQTGARFAF